jgi:hypothetical protein
MARASGWHGGEVLKVIWWEILKERGCLKDIEVNATNNNLYEYVC